MKKIIFSTVLSVTVLATCLLGIKVPVVHAAALPSFNATISDAQDSVAHFAGAPMLSAKSQTAPKYSATFYKGSFPGLDKSTTPTKSFASRGELRRYGISVLRKLKKNKNTENAAKNVQNRPAFKKMYQKYNNSFFKEKNLVVALVDQGTGSAKYSVQNITAKNGELVISVKKTTPTAVTMDYVSWMMLLEIDKDAYTYDTVRVNLV